MTTFNNLNELGFEDGHIEALQITDESIWLTFCRWNDHRIQLKFEGALYLETMPNLQGAEIKEVRAQEVSDKYIWVLSEAYTTRDVREQELKHVRLVQFFAHYGEYPTLTLIAESVRVD